MRVVSDCGLAWGSGPDCGCASGGLHTFEYAGDRGAWQVWGERGAGCAGSGSCEAEWKQWRADDRSGAWCRTEAGGGYAACCGGSADWESAADAFPFAAASVGSESGDAYGAASSGYGRAVGGGGSERGCRRHFRCGGGGWPSGEAGDIGCRGWSGYRDWCGGESGGDSA